MRKLAALLGATGVVALVVGGTGSASAAPAWTFAGARNANVRAIAFDPANARTIYAAARNDGVWISRDGGSSWSKSDAGLEYVAAWSVSVDPVKPNVVWAATEVGGAYRSTDFGRTWKHTHAGLTDSLADYQVVVPPVPSSTELLRPVLSSGGNPSAGGLFRDLNPDKANRGGMWGYVVDQCVSDQEQSGAAGKCAERADWAIGGYDYRDPDVDDATTGEQPGAPYPRTLVRFQFSSDVVATPGGALLSAFRGSNNRLGGGLFATRDAGATWSMALRNADGNRMAGFGIGNAGANIWRVRVAPSDPKVVYLASTGGVWASRDGGKTWPSAATAHGGTVEHSIDGEVTADTRGLAVSPSDANVVYAGTWGAGVRVSRDGGVTWSDSSSGLPARSGVWSLSFDPRNAKRMLAAVYWHGVYESLDAGTTWSARNDGFDADSNRQVYAVEASRDGTLFAGTINGVWKMASSTETRVGGERRTRPLPGTGLGDTVLIVVGAVLVAVAAGIAWMARSR